MTGPISNQARGVLAAGLAWLYDTEQPEGAILSHHGVSKAAGEHSFRFIGEAADGLPAIVVELVNPRYSYPGGDRHLDTPIGKVLPRQLAETIADLGHHVGDQWNWGNSTSGSLGLVGRAHPTLRGGLARYRSGCPEHRTVFCGGWQASPGQEDCTWMSTGRKLIVEPDWPPVDPVYRYMCPGEPGDAPATTIHVGGCCRRFDLLTPEGQALTGLRWPR